MSYPLVPAPGANFLNHPLVATARVFAQAAHGSVGQRRKFTDAPYIVHPTAVAQRVAMIPKHEPEWLAAAYLHDVLEDTPVTLAEIKALFGHAIASLVDELTDKSTPADGPRAARKAAELVRLASISPAAQTIKVADICDNLATIHLHEPGFAAMYVTEKAAQIEVLSAADEATREHARDLIGRFAGVHYRRPPRLITIGPSPQMDAP